MFVNFSVHHHLRYLDMTEIDTFLEIEFPYLPENKFTTHLVIIISIVALLRLQDFVVFFWVGEMLLLDM